MDVPIDPSWPVFIAESISRASGPDLAHDDPSSACGARGERARGCRRARAPRRWPPGPRAPRSREGTPRAGARPSPRSSPLAPRRESRSPARSAWWSCRGRTAGHEDVQPAPTAARRKPESSGVTVARRTRSSRLSATMRWRRIVRHGRRAIGGSSPCKRGPSGRRTSTAGEASSIRLPDSQTIRQAGTGPPHPRQSPGRTRPWHRRPGPRTRGRGR